MTTKTIEPTISKYIDQAIERGRVVFSVDMRKYILEIDEKNRTYIDEAKKEIKQNTQKEFFNHMGALREGFQHQVDMLIELVSSKPDTEKVREIVREEVKAIETRLSLTQNVVAEHRHTLDKHDCRLTKLENVIQ